MSKINMLLMVASVMAFGDNLQMYKREEATPEQLKHKAEFDKIKINKANGLKEFDINGKKIWAINQKNAERKYNKLYC